MCPHLKEDSVYTLEPGRTGSNPGFVTHYQHEIRNLSSVNCYFLFYEVEIIMILTIKGFGED